MVLFFHDEVNLTALRASSYDRPFRDARHADLFVGWQSTLREHWHSRRFNSCAVVGSSGSLLLGQPRGALIDQHDAVFRVNYAPTRGYEEYVGVGPCLGCEHEREREAPSPQDFRASQPDATSGSWRSTPPPSLASAAAAPYIRDLDPLPAEPRAW